MTSCCNQHKSIELVLIRVPLSSSDKIFREVYVNFMIVGHTHDDIDALFRRWSMILKKENFPTVPTLMKSFMDLDSMPTMPHLIEEVLDFKGFIARSFVDGNNILVGHTRPQHEVLPRLHGLPCHEVQNVLH